jgi:4-hydroxy-tetrahydrodipicolinate synthase
VISVLANAWPKEFNQMVKWCLDNKYAEASAIWKKWLDLNPLLYEEGNPVGIKAVMKELGLCGDTVRLPLLSASTGLAERIRKAI